MSTTRNTTRQRLPLILATAALMTACGGQEYDLPEAPQTLDPGPYPAALGENVTVLGPANTYLATGMDIFNSRIASGSAVGKILAPGQGRVSLTNPQTLSGTRGSIREYIPTVRRLPCSGQELWAGMTASSDANYFVPDLYSYNPKAPPPSSPYPPAFPALVADGHIGWVKTGYFVYVDHDTTLSGEAKCNFQTTSTYTLKVNVSLKAGWNVLKEQAVSRTVDRVDVVDIVMTGAASDYTIE